MRANTGVKIERYVRNPMLLSLLRMSRISHVPSFTTLEEYRRSVLSLSRRQSALSIPRSSIVASHLSIPGPVIGLSSAVGQEEEEVAPMQTGLSKMMDFRLLSNKYFLLIGLSNVLGMLGFYTPFVYLPGMAVKMGDNISVQDANLLLSMIGVSNTIGRVLAGWVSDFAWTDSLVLTNLAILGSGATVLVLPLVRSYAMYATLALLFGLAVAAYISLTSVVLVDLLGLDSLTSAFGLLVLFRGVSSVVGSPLAGFVFDQTQSYEASFFFSGLMLLAAGAVSGLADILRRRETRSSKADHVSVQ